MRHAQYRQELADAVEKATAGLLFAIPAIAVQWTGSALARTGAGAWVHQYDVEIRVGEQGPELDLLVKTVALAVAAWDPNTSSVTASPPDVRPVTVLDGEITYPAVIVSTVVNEPSTD